jgi:chaperonin GroEL
MPILEAARAVGMPPIVIIAEDFSPEVIATMVINKAQGLCNICAVKLAIYGESRHQRAADLATITGATLISEQLGTMFETFEPTMFGRCSKCIVTTSTTTIIDGAGNPDEIAKLRTSLLTQIEAAAPESFEKIQLTARLNYVKGGVAIIKVGAATSAEMKEKRDRVDDAINAVRAAILEGTVPGGGSTFIRCAMDLREHIDSLATDDPLRPGMRIIERALSAPITRLFNNARIESRLPEVIASIKNTDECKNEVYDIRSNTWGSAYELGLIDPAAVLTNALINASSIATLLLTTNAVVVAIPEDNKAQPNPGMQMM